MRGILADWATVKARFRALRPHDFCNSRSFGYCAIRAWVFLLFLNVGGNLLGASRGPVPSSIFLISSIALSLTLFIAGARPHHFNDLLDGRNLRYLGPALTVMGSIFLILAYAGIDGSLLRTIVDLCAGLLTGIGSGLITLGYGVLYRDQPPEKTGLEIPTATLLAAALYTILQFTPAVINVIVIIALPLISSYLLMETNHIWQPGHAHLVEPLPFEVGNFTWRIGICAGMVSAADGFIRQIFMYTHQLTTTSLLQVGMLTSCAIAFIIIVGYRLTVRNADYQGLYKVVLFIMAVAFLLVPVMTGSGLAEKTTILVSYNTFNVMIWLLLAEIAYNYRLSGLAVFGIGWGMLTIGTTGGQYLANVLLAASPVITQQQLSLITMIATLIIFAAFMFVLSENTLEDITSTEDLPSAAEHDEEPSASPASAAQPEAPATPETLRTPAAATEASGSGHPENRKDRDSRPIPFNERCRRVARQFKLTAREEEIMTLVAKGRTSARIQEELVLSRGTVTTHLQHIYQKMGIHSKQELLDIIEGFR